MAGGAVTGMGPLGIIADYLNIPVSLRSLAETVPAIISLVNKHR